MADLDLLATLRPTDLASLIRQVRPCMADTNTSSGMALLESIWLRLDGNQLTATATNRYILGRAAVDTLAATDDGSYVVVARRHLFPLTTWLQQLDTNTVDLRVSSTVVELWASGTYSVRVPRLQDTPPDVHAFLEDPADQDVTARTMLRGSMLRQFLGAAQLSDAPTRVVITAPDKPVRFERQGFVGIVMPVKDPQQYRPIENGPRV